MVVVGLIAAGLIAAAGGGLIARIAARRVQRWVHRLLGVTVSALWRMVVVGGHEGWSAAGVTDPVSAGLISQAATAATWHGVEVAFFWHGRHLRGLVLVVGFQTCACA